MQKLLEQLYDELTDAARSTNRIYKAAKIPQDYFTYAWKLKHHLRDRLGTKRISLEQLLQLCIPKWKSEGRLKVRSSTDLSILLNEQEAELLGLGGSRQIDIYELFRLMMGMFETPHIKN